MNALGTVLVIEPNKALQQKIRSALPETNLVFVNDNRKALEAVTRHEPAAVLLKDAHDPSPVGFELLTLLRIKNDVPVVILSVHKEKAQTFAVRNDAPATAVTITDVNVLRGYLPRLIAESAALKSFRTTYLKGVKIEFDRENELTHEEENVLESVGFPIHAKFDPAPIAARMARFQNLLSSSLTTESAAKRLHVNASRIRQRLLATPPRLYGIRHQNEWRLPAFQFGAQGLVPNIELVIARLPPTLDPVAVESWFRQPNVDLVHEGQVTSPLVWLAQGLAVEPVLALAEDL